MLGSEGDDDYKAIPNLEGEGEDDLGLFGDLSAFEGLALEEDGELRSEGRNACPQCMGKYKNPRVLSCLHVLCENCLKELLIADDDARDEDVVYSGRSRHRTIIMCPLCKQETMVGDRGLNSLPLDPVFQSQSSSDSSLSGLICTSCKANEEAIAKCVDCGNLLCSICKTAHKYMRCFENHKVITFEELVQSGQPVAARKSPSCPRHSTELYKYYCNSCRVAACSQCLSAYHMTFEHRTERLSDAESRSREELMHFSEQVSLRQNTCRINANKLDKMLGELESQYETSRQAVTEAHRACSALLDKKRDQVLEELSNLHAKQELSVMEACERVDRTRDRIQAALRYTKLLLEEAEPAGIVGLHSCIKSQMQLLHNTASRPDDVQVCLKFESNPPRFEEALDACFGYFVGGAGSSTHSKPVSSLGLPTPSSTPLPPSPTHSSPLDAAGMHQAYLPSNILKNDLTHSVLLSSLAASHQSMAEVPSQQAPQQQQQQHDLSSLNLSSLSSSYNPLSSMRLDPYGSSQEPLGSVGSMTSIQEYNLQRLASLAGKNDCQSSMAQSNSGQQQAPGQGAPFKLADLLPMNVSSHALNNLQALAKLGSHGGLGMDGLGGCHSGVHGMGTNLGLLVNGSSSVLSGSNGLNSPLEASLLASALSAPPFVPSASVNYGMRYTRSDISSGSSHWRH